MARYTKFKKGRVTYYKPYKRGLKRKRRDYAFKKAKRAAKSVLLRQAETKCFRSINNTSGIASSTGGGGPTPLVFDNIAVYNITEHGVSGTRMSNSTTEATVIGAQIRTLWLKTILTVAYNASAGISSDTMAELTVVASDDYLTPYNNGNFSVGVPGTAANWWISQGSGSNVFDVTFNSKYVTVIKQKRFWLKGPGFNGTGPVNQTTLRKMKVNLKGNRKFRADWGSGVGTGNQFKGKNFYIIVRLVNRWGANASIDITANLSWHLYYKDI